jgi:hypothetical protein
MRAKTVRSRDYRIFYEGLCQRKVPIILVVTGLEGEERMEDWWDRNKSLFEKQQMVFDGHACITATMGKWRNNGYMFAREYQESRDKVSQLVLKHCSEEVLKAERLHLGVIDIVKIIFNISTRMLHIPPLMVSDELYEVLVKQGGYLERDAREIANEAEISGIHKSGGWLPRSNT